MTLDPELIDLHLAADGRATALPGGEAFWSLPEDEMARHGDGWLEGPQAVEIEIVGMSREADRCGKIDRAELVEGELATVAGERESRCR